MSKQRNVHVCVIGAGIMGLSTAYAIALKHPQCYITVISDKYTPDTTSNHSFGIIALRTIDKEFDCANTPRWAIETFERCRHLYEKHNEKTEDIGLSKVSGTVLYDKKCAMAQKDEFSMYNSPLLQLTCSNSREATEQEIKSEKFGERIKDLGRVLGRSDMKTEDIGAYRFDAFVVDNDAYLPWLQGQIKLLANQGKIAGVEFIKRKILSLSEVLKQDYDVIVNASGLNAGFLAQDRNMVPIRGQYILAKVDKPVDLIYGGHTFVCPKPGRIAIGSVYQIGRADTETDPIDTKDIFERGCIISPALKSAKILKVDVGIRPGRIGGPRVELEWVKCVNKEVPIVHNYGHGPRGILQHWGSALDAENLFAHSLKIFSRL